MATLHFLDPPLSSLTWTVLELHGEEALSALFHFDLVATASLHAVLDAAHAGSYASFELAAVGERVAFQIDAAVGSLSRYGIVTAVTLTGLATQEVGGEASVRARFEVAPRAWLMQHTRRSRVFQDRYVLEVIDTVLRESGVSYQWALANAYPRRPYCVQYDETDWEFVTRLLAEEGVWFFFLHGDFAGGVSSGGGGGGVTWQQVRQYAGTASQVAGYGAGMGGLMGTIAAAGGLSADFIAEYPDDETRDERFYAPHSPPSPGQRGEPGDTAVLTLTDHPRYSPTTADARGFLGLAAAPPPTVLTLRDAAEGAVADAHALDAFMPRRAVRPERVELRDVFFRKPLVVYRAASRVDDSGLKAPMEHYRHHGESERPDVSGENARNHLEQLRADASTYHARGHAPELVAGLRVAVENHTAAPVHEGRYAVTRVRHTWRALAAAPAHAYANELECVDAATPCRPPFPRRVPRTATELATVVGPPDQEIYTDACGRVRIQLHWDREGRFLQDSSCWVRVAQPWAGAGFGVQFLPRVGMEVLVAFVGGDPDRPVVVGALHNGTHALPEEFPAHATRSTIRTQSVPGGGGFNELSFEDAKGAERVYIHAQKHFDVLVQDSQTLSVKNEQSVLVGADQREGVGGAQRVSVGGDRVAQVGGADVCAVGGDRRALVEGTASEDVLGDTVARRRGMLVDTVDHGVARGVGGSESVHIQGDRVVTVGGAEANLLAHDLTFVQGSSRLYATHAVYVIAIPTSGDGDGEVHLHTNGATVTLSGSSITLSGADVTVKATGTLRLESGGGKLVLDGDGAHLSGTVTSVLNDSGAGVTADSGAVEVVGPSSVVIKGPAVSISTGGGGDKSARPAGSTADPLPNNFKLRLTHGRHRAAAKLIKAPARYRLSYDGTLAEGTLENDGVLEALVPDTITRVEVTVWPVEDDLTHYDPQDLPLRWVVDVVPDLSSVGDLDRARARLANLGYAVSPQLGVGFDARTAAALRRFQHDQRRKVTGALDHDTGSKLQEVSGS